MSYQIELTKQAREDIDGIYRYIALSLLSPDVAANMYHDIIKSIRSLDIFPLRNALVDEAPWKSRGLIKLLVKKYMVLYTVDENINVVRIIRIMYSGRNHNYQLSEITE